MDTYKQIYKSQKITTTNIIKLLWILTMTDALITDIGIRLNLVAEANPLVRVIYDWNILAFYLFKFLFPALLLVLYPAIQSKKWINRGIYLCLALYIIVNIYHIFWISLVVFTY